MIIKKEVKKLYLLITQANLYVVLFKYIFKSS